MAAGPASDPYQHPDPDPPDLPRHRIKWSRSAAEVHGSWIGRSSTREGSSDLGMGCGRLPPRAMNRAFGPAPFTGNTCGGKCEQKCGIERGCGRLPPRARNKAFLDREHLHTKVWTFNSVNA